MLGEKIIEYSLDITGITDSGTAFEDILSGKEIIPPQGVRVDVAFCGKITGKINGEISGVDYIYLRADGRINLDIKAKIVTEDGQKIALTADGASHPSDTGGIAELAENVQLLTSSERYAWVNKRQIWAYGTVNFSIKTIELAAYMQ